MKMITWRLAGMILAAAASLAQAQTLDVTAIDRLVSDSMRKNRLPGLSVGVMHQGRIVLAKGYGVASLETREQVTTETMFGIGSVTKQFTCVLALQLADEGKISMSDRVSKYFPKASHGSEISLMDLGNHVSGYRDYYPLDFPDRAMMKARSASAIIDDHVKGVDFAPGTRWSYSNTGFLMLGEVVAEVEGRPFEQVLAQRVLKPLAMTRTAYQLGPGANGAATGYGSFMMGEPSPAMLEGKGWLGGAGGIWSTPTDLLAWDLALMEGKLLSRASMNALTAARRLADGRSSNYACGLGIGDRDGMLAWAHGGAVSGFTARNVMLPGSRSAIVLMTNMENARAALFELYVAIARLLSPPPRSQPPAIDGPPALSVAASLIAQMQAGTPDRSRLGDEFNAFLTPERVQAAAASLGPLGKPKSIEITGTDERGAMEHTTILFKFDSASAEAEMYRTPDGLVQQFLVSRK